MANTSRGCEPRRSTVSSPTRTSRLPSSAIDREGVRVTSSPSSTAGLCHLHRPLPYVVPLHVAAPETDSVGRNVNGRVDMSRSGFARRLVKVFVVVAAVGVLAACEPLPPPQAGSVLIGCDRADERVEITVTSHLDPTCVYTSGFDITASDVVFDCQDALIKGPAGAGGRGIRVETPVDTPLSDVTIRNCNV